MPSGDEHDDEQDRTEGLLSPQRHVNPVKGQAGGMEPLASSRPAAGEESKMSPAGKTSSPDASAAMQSLMNDLASVVTAHIGTIGHDSSSQMADLRERLKASETERCALQTRVSDLLTRLSTLESERERLELEGKSLPDKLNVGAAHADKAAEDVNGAAESRQVDQLVAELKSKSDEITDLKEQLDEANASLEVAAEIEKRLEEVASFKQRKENEIAELKRQIEQQRTINAKTVNELRDQLIAADQDKLNLNKQIGHLMSTANDTAEKHNRRDIEVANHIDDLKRQVHDASKKIEGHDRLVAQLNQNINKAEKQILELTKQRKDLEAKLKDVEETQCQTGNELETKNTLLEVQKMEIESLKAKNETSRTELGDAKIQCEMLKKQVEEARMRFEEAKSQLVDVQPKYETSQTDLTAMLAQLNEKDERLKQQEALLKEKDSQLQESVAERASHEAQMAELLQQREEAMRNGEKLEKKCEDFERQCEELKQRLAESELSDNGSLNRVVEEPVVEDTDPVLEQDAREPSMHDGDIVAEPVAEAESSPLDGIEDDIDWLEPTPPSAPKDVEPEEEPSRGHEEPDNRQMSLF